MQYHPHDYQTYATNFILEHPVAAVLLEMGLGKSVCTLTAIYELMLNRFEVESVLVIAPLRVARDTWPAEIEKWDHLRGLRYSIVVGTAAERKKALAADADIFIINRENVPWLIDGSGYPFVRQGCSGAWCAKIIRDHGACNGSAGRRCLADCRTECGGNYRAYRAVPSGPGL